jgi:hypothetical protein
LKEVSKKGKIIHVEKHGAKPGIRGSQREGANITFSAAGGAQGAVTGFITNVNVTLKNLPN